MWTHRLLLEMRSHEFNCFATLTYDDDHLPEGGVLVKRHYQLFLKRLRKSLAKNHRSLRYFLVGEYGTENERPHYHACLFGLSHIEVDLVGAAWPYGFVRLDKLDEGLATYICKYVVKAYKVGNPALDGRPPEFARMSTAPGLGFPYVRDRLGSTLSSTAGRLALAALGDVPTQLTTHGKSLPLGRYLTAKLREVLGYEPGVPPEVEKARQLQMLDVYLAAESPYQFHESRKAERLQKVLQMKGKALIESTRKKATL